MEKLKKLSEYALAKNDIQLRYSNAIILGDIRERIKILAETGQCSIIYY